MFVRLSATDWIDGGWDTLETVDLSIELAALGVDLIDVSAGGLVPHQNIPELHPGYQVPYARAVREGAGILVGAVGLLSSAEDLQAPLRRGDADVVFAGRQLLREPHSPLRIAFELQQQVEWPEQYRHARYR